MNSTGGDEIQRRSVLTGVEVSRYSGAVQVELGDGGRGVVPGPEAKLRWWVAGPGAQRGGVAAAAGCPALGGGKAGWRS